jgi:FlaA1/EpsC-like NDP-sugar epimerase
MHGFHKRRLFGGLARAMTRKVIFQIFKSNIIVRISLVFFWYFLLTTENTANRQVRNLFYLLVVFISFPRRAARLNPTPPPFFGGRKAHKKMALAASWSRFVKVYSCVS